MKGSRFPELTILEANDTPTTLWTAHTKKALVGILNGADVRRRALLQKSNEPRWYASHPETLRAGLEGHGVGNNCGRFNGLNNLSCRYLHTVSRLFHDRSACLVAARSTARDRELAVRADHLRRQYRPINHLVHRFHRPKDSFSM
ncbi:hypothetical protein VTI28DRAFT_6710 [Corynascus sepedonium]